MIESWLHPRRAPTEATFAELIRRLEAEIAVLESGQGEYRLNDGERVEVAGRWALGTGVRIGGSRQYDGD
jgi:hypothetical protein